MSNYLPLQEVEADDLNAFLGLYARKNTDETVNSAGTGATLQDDDHLNLTAAINLVYRFETLLRISTNSTANFKWSFVIPAGATLVYSALHIPAGGTSLTFTELINSAVGTADDGVPYVKMLGTLQTAGTGGPVKLQWAQNTANAGDTKVRDGSFMSLHRMF